MPQLDGLRALAFVMVASSHWIPDAWQFNIPLGTGVQLFFVLSGFLITGILLRNRADESGLPIGSALRAFYIRRVLRIFPLYYLVLAVCVAFSVGPIRETWPWHWSYLSNFYYASHAPVDAIRDPYLHFWSLAVEEQFYLVWPLIALTTPRRRLAWVIVGSIVVALLFRVGVGSYTGRQWAARYLTPSCLDALGVGALMAYAQHYFGSAGLRRAKHVAAGIGMGGLVLAVPSSAWAGSQLMHWAGHTFLVIFYGAIVAQAAEGLGGALGHVMAARPVMYLGKISYGLYVYHHFAPLAFATLLARAGLTGTRWESWPYTFVSYSVLTLLTATLSWHGYEMVFLRMKRWFDYRSIAPATPRLTAVPTPPSL